MALTDQQELFLELLFDKNVASPQEAADLAGYKASLTAILRSKELSKAILDRTQSYTAIHAPRAIMSILDVMQSPNKKGASNAINAAKEILDRGGLVKKDKLEVETNQQTAVVFLPQLND